jgi:hypothetical protein
LPLLVVFAGWAALQFDQMRLDVHDLLHTVTDLKAGQEKAHEWLIEIQKRLDQPAGRRG